MDLNDFKPKSDTVTINITHPGTGEPLLHDDGKPMFVEVYAQYSPEYKELLHEATNKRIKKMQGKKVEYPTSQDLENSGLELLAAATKSWSITYKKEKVKLSKDKAVELYRDLFWLKDQIEEGLSEPLDFTKA